MPEILNALVFSAYSYCASCTLGSLRAQPTVIVPHAHWEAYGRGSLPLHNYLLRGKPFLVTMLYKQQNLPSHITPHANLCLELPPPPPLSSRRDRAGTRQRS